jgi:hypothetical protein
MIGGMPENLGPQRQQNFCSDCGNLVLDRQKFCGKCDTQNPLFSVGAMVTTGAMTAGAMDMVREIATDTGKDIYLLGWNVFLFQADIVQIKSSCHPPPP